MANEGMTLEIFVDKEFRRSFDEIIRDSKLEIIKEEKTPTGVGDWVTVRIATSLDAYLLGVSFGSVKYRN